jgi:PAS domain S-box-containing protein
MAALKSNWQESVALAAGTIIGILGVSVLVAWQFHYLPLIQIGLTLPPMHRTTALEFVLGGLALVLLSRGRRRMAGVVALAMLIPPLVALLEYFLQADFGIDEILGRDTISPPSSHPGRLSPITAVCFLAGSLSLLAMSSRILARRAAGIVGTLACILVAVGAVVLLASLGHTKAYGWGYFSRIGIHTGAGHLLTGVGLIALALKEGRAWRAPPRWVAVGVGLGLGIVALGFWQALIQHEQALIQHEESQIPMLSRIILAGGILGALLIAVSVYLAQKARLRSRELQEGKEVFERLFQASPDALLVIDGDGRILAANQRIGIQFGYSQAEILGASIEKLVPEMRRGIHEAYCHDYYARPGTRPMGLGLDLSGRRKDGSMFPVDVALNPLRPHDQTRVLAVVRDITGPKLAQEALRQSEERFRELFEQGPIGIAVLGLDRHFIKVNAALSRMLGYSEAEFTAMTPLDITLPGDRPATATLMERLLRGHGPEDKVVKRYAKKNGEIMWASVNVKMIRDSRGTPLYAMAMIEDITERKWAEDEVRALNERLSLATEIGSMGVWDWDLRTNLEVWDDASFAMLGFPRVNPVPHDKLVARIHPDDRATVETATQRVIRRKTQETVEFRVLRTDGSLRHLSVAAGAVLDDRGETARIVGIAMDITERKQAEEKLRTVSQRLSQALAFASMSVWQWEPRTNDFAWDDAAFQMAGIPKQVPLPYERWRHVVHPEDLPRTEVALQKIVAEKKQESVEFRVIRPDGGLRHAYAAGGPVLDAQGRVIRVVGIAADITERKHTEDELRTLTQRLSLATRAASMGVWELNLDNYMAIWDDMMFQIFGIPKMARVIRKDWEQLLHPDDRPKVESFLDTIVTARTQHTMEFRIVRADGALRYLFVSGAPVVDKSGRVTDVVGIVLDITERRQLELELEAAREQAISSARLSALGMMAGGVAHEINNPLAIIHALASDLSETVKEHGSAPARMVERNSRKIRQTAERIAGIVRSLRTISREGSKDKTRMVPVSKILEDTLEVCEARFKAHSVQLIVPEEPGLSVNCREVQIEQALLNLLQNAFDAVAEQKGERWVRLDVTPRDGVVAISVTDSGPGIPAELRPRVGEPFFTTKEVGKGTGLGLSLSKTIAEEHGGSIEYGEENGHTRFSLVLPLGRQAEAA